MMSDTVIFGLIMLGVGFSIGALWFGALWWGERKRRKEYDEVFKAGKYYIKETLING